MIDRLSTLLARRRHPRSAVFSSYLDGDLDARERRALETHVRECPRCRRELASLADTVQALGSLDAPTSPGLADSIIAALRAEDSREVAISKRVPESAGQPFLTVIAGSGQPTIGERIRRPWPEEARAALRWCLRRPQLRLTLPITLVAGVVLTLVNMGGMLMHGRIDLSVCLMCATDFLVPFLALNLGLVMLLRLPRRRRL